jgi:hypothetical protein
MPNARDNVKRHAELQVIRNLQKLAAEQRAHKNSMLLDQVDAKLQQYRNQTNLCIIEWENSASNGNYFDPVMTELWATELSACKHKVAVVEKERSDAQTDLDTARSAWQQTMTISEQSANAYKLAVKRYERKSDAKRLFETEDIASNQARTR